MPTAKPKKVRASILVTRWGVGSNGQMDGEHTERISVPLSQIELVEPYACEIWLSFKDQQHGPGSCRARINLKDDSFIAVTETVEEVDRLMNTPIGEPA